MDILGFLYETLNMRDCFSDANTDEAYNKVISLIMKDEGVEQGNKFNEAEGALLEFSERKSRLAFTIGLQAGMKLKGIEDGEFPKLEI